MTPEELATENTAERRAVKEAKREADAQHHGGRRALTDEEILERMSRLDEVERVPEDEVGNRLKEILGPFTKADLRRGEELSNKLARDAEARAGAIGGVINSLEDLPGYN